MHSQDAFVGSVAILLGLAALAAAVSGGRLVRWSGLAQSIARRGGTWAVVVIYSIVGLFLIGVGISILR